MQKKEYGEIVKKHTPNSPMWKNMLWAFLVGGTICLIGQILNTFFESRGMEAEMVPSAVSISLIFFSILLTSLDVYDGIAKHAGAGTIVPITGFANAVAAPAIEFKTEGYILGVGAKMFTVAGPVITYGVVSSVLAGVVYYLFLM